MRHHLRMKQLKDIKTSERTLFVPRGWWWWWNENVKRHFWLMAGDTNGLLLRLVGSVNIAQYRKRENEKNILVYMVPSANISTCRCRRTTAEIPVVASSTITCCVLLQSRIRNAHNCIAHRVKRSEKSTRHMTRLTSCNIRFSCFP